MLYLGEVVEDVEAALGDGDVHSVFGADADGRARFRKNDKVVSMNGTLVLDWVVFHLKEKRKKKRQQRMFIKYFLIETAQFRWEWTTNG